MQRSRSKLTSISRPLYTFRTPSNIRPLCTRRGSAWRDQMSAFTMTSLARSSVAGDGRCAWADSSPGMRDYHDLEWGVPSHDDRKLFEMLTLEGAQAGLSWATILNRRDGYRRAFASFDPAKVAAFSDSRLEKLREDTGIIRNRLKIYAARTNARAFVKVQAEFGS